MMLMIEERRSMFRSGHLRLDSAYCGRPKSVYLHKKSNDFEDSRGCGTHFKPGHLGLDSAYCGRPKTLHFHLEKR